MALRSFVAHLPMVLAAAALVGTDAGPAAAQKSPSVKPMLSVFKTATCGCCAKWVDHMRANGFDAQVKDVENIDEVRQQLGVPPRLGSCHTARVGRYVVEGHIPSDAVHRLLKERPAVSGLAVPGMPIGSPGMEVPGGYRQPYAILTFDRAGQTTVYERR